MVTQFGLEVIKSVPYSAIVFFPPGEFHQSAFFKIAYIEGGRAEIAFQSRKSRETLVKQCDVGDAFNIDTEKVSILPSFFVFWASFDQKSGFNK